MKKKIVARWEKPLKQVLLGKIKVRGLKERDQKDAVSEILRGVRFFESRGLDTKVALNRNFDIGNACRCLFAKNSKEGYFLSALDEFNVSFSRACKMGFCRTDRWGKWESSLENLLEQDHQTTQRKNWRKLFNIIWRRVGQFFEANPHFDWTVNSK